MLKVRQHVPGEQVALRGVRVAGQDERLYAQLGVAAELGKHLVGVTDDSCARARASPADPGPQIRLDVSFVVGQVAELTLA